MTATDIRNGVLIAGAGPTGLALALGLARRGIALRIVDAAEGPGQQSRAMAVQARTLEFYRQFGFAESVVDAGIVTERAHLREGGTQDSPGREILTIDIGRIGKGLSPYPFVLDFPQDDHERLLIGELRKIGVEVEWRTQLTGFTQTDAAVEARLQGPDGQESGATAAYLCGCDGAHSRVRQVLGLGFPGGTYPMLFYVADVVVEGGFDRDLTVNLGADTLALLLPVRSRGVQRLIGLAPPELEAGDVATFETIRDRVEPLIGRRVTQVNWFSTYRVHHRVADRFRAGRAFILGDAGHIHSPAGGQGMNTGIGDGFNLAWKLAMRLQDRAPEALLDSYEAERIVFARALVATTDRAFTAMVSRGVAGRFIRRLAAPTLMKAATSLAFGQRFFFRTISQTEIRYPESALSEGRAGDVRGGDRLPWVEGDPDNFAPLASLDWQAHVYGLATPEIAAACAAESLPLHALPWTETAEAAGLRRNAFYLVRPDGHVALAALPDAAPGALRRYAETRGLRLGG